MQLYLLYLQIIPTFVPIKSNPIINKTSTAVMKKKTILFASCLFGVFAFSSCEKNLYRPCGQPGTAVLPAADRKAAHPSGRHGLVPACCLLSVLNRKISSL